MAVRLCISMCEVLSLASRGLAGFWIWQNILQPQLSLSLFPKRECFPLCCMFACFTLCFVEVEGMVDSCWFTFATALS